MRPTAEQILINALAAVTDNAPILVVTEAEIDPLLAATEVADGHSIAFVIIDSDGGSRNRAEQGNLITADTYGLYWVVRCDSPAATDIANAMRSKVSDKYPALIDLLAKEAINGYPIEMDFDRMVRRGGSNFIGVFGRITYSYERLITT